MPSSSSSTTSKPNHFVDLDDLEVYDGITKKVCDVATKNFVVDFGKDDAQIAYSLSIESFDAVLKEQRLAERPIRWINLWAPNQQTDIIDAIDKEYAFSSRLSAIIKTAPPKARKLRSYGRSDSGIRKSMQLREDLERGVKGETQSSSSSIPPAKPRASATHYTIAQQMLHYHSIDAGKRFLCIGANWIHELANKQSEDAGLSEGERTTLWSWLLLCDDHTVISIHQDPGEHDEVKALESIRGNTISVLKQLSSRGRESADPISIQTVRQALKSPDEEEIAPVSAGVEGASSLFYYLFDDWRAVYSTVGNFQFRLNELEKVIIGTHELKSTTSSIPTNEIIPRLHKLGRQFRQMEHLYKGYKNLIDRVLEHDTPASHGRTTPRSLTGLTARTNGVGLAPSAKRRFTRLRDRIELMILSELKEFHDEKSALVDTYFNITAQKDSEATARLTRAATLLAKLSVLFLPVSLMTAYFSIQIKELEGVYTAKDYWYSFAVIMTISVLGLFFFAKSLMWLTETLDDKMKKLQKTVRRAVVGKKKRTEDEDSEME